MALTHANMAPADNPHTVAAIASLTDAVTHGNMDHAPVATGMANTGLMSLQVAVHVHQVMDHNMQAVTHGDMGHAPVLVTHAEVALTHARAAAEISDSPHIVMAIEALESAILHGGMGHAEIATESAKTAQSHLKM